MSKKEKLEKEIGKTEDLGKIITTMKNISSANINIYQRRVSCLRQYIRTIEMGFQILCRKEPDINTRIQIRAAKEEESYGMIVLGSERGLCGDFNEKILSFFLREKEKKRGKKLFLISIGDKISNKLAHLENRQSYSFPSSFLEIADFLWDLLPTLEDWIKEKGVREISFFYNRLTEGLQSKPTEKLLFPLDYFWFQQLKEEPWESRTRPFFRSSIEELFFALLQEYFFSSIYQAFAESLASEQASRLVSMQSAEENIDDQKEELVREYHKERQKEITEELSDILSGFECLREKK